MRKIKVYTGWQLTTAASAIILLYSAPTFAHIGAGMAGGFSSGFLHPIRGGDHVIAMVAVGLWGAFLGNPAIWLLPVLFPLVMALGGVAGILGFPVPAVEVGIAVSAITLGAMVAAAARPPLAIAAALVAFFSIFHGYAHGAELPSATNPLIFSLGFVISTGLLHLTGIAMGTLVHWPTGRIAVRATGGAIALGGVAYLLGWL